MAEYWCRFIDRKGRVYASEKLIATDDAEAVAKARAITLRDPEDGFELLQGSRQVPIEVPPRELAGR